MLSGIVINVMVSWCWFYRFVFFCSLYQYHSWEMCSVDCFSNENRKHLFYEVELQNRTKDQKYIEALGPKLVVSSTWDSTQKAWILIDFKTSKLHWFEWDAKECLKLRERCYRLIQQIVLLNISEVANAQRKIVTSTTSFV